MGNKPGDVVVGNLPDIGHLSTGLEPLGVSPMEWWVCEAQVVRDEQLGNREPCGLQNPSWQNVCQDCGSSKPK